ncbi:MAG TPA: class II aldolase/adducin family protein [Micropepsaceae bacterium]|jgi:L-fuculose-phosphate aldolase|nr:class II aldolase/adducin family protein [Micropepsaceae bacterium]
MDKSKAKLADAGRVLAHEGQGDYVAGHVSLRLPDDPNRFYMKPAGIGLEEMTDENIITVDIEGNKVAGSAGRHNEVFIHSEVLRARPDCNAVIHTHAVYAVVFSSLGKPLLPVSNDGAFFANGLPVFSETTELIINQARGRAVARDLGAHGALLLRNHGIVTAAATMEEAVWLALKLNQACHVQLMAEWAGGPKFVGDPGEAKIKGAYASRPDLHAGAFNYVLRRSKR